MNLYVLSLVALLVIGLLGSGLVIFIGYKWGSFAALQALAENSPKWKAYFLALLPPAAFALTFLFDGSLQPFASETFWALSTPAVIVTCVQINQRSDSTI